jgi:hypothetical protein
MSSRYEHDRETLTDTDSAPLAGARKSRRPIFDPTINLGHVLTFIGFLAVGGGAYLNIEKRVTVQEVRSEMFERASKEDIARTSNAISDIRNDIKEVRRGVDELRKVPPNP